MGRPKGSKNKAKSPYMVGSDMITMHKTKSFNPGLPTWVPCLLWFIIGVLAGHFIWF